MSHFAKINSDGIVTQVVVAEQEFIDSGALGPASDWIQTSYSGSIRGRFAGIGYTYDSALDVFYPPKPYPSWTLDKETYIWVSGVSPPTQDRPYIWDEATTRWVDM